MRVIVDLDVDADGRPVGTLRASTAVRAQRFGDWLDLLRLLEECVESARASRADTSDTQEEQ